MGTMVLFRSVAESTQVDCSARRERDVTMSGIDFNLVVAFTVSVVLSTLLTEMAKDIWSSIKRFAKKLIDQRRGRLK